MRFPRFLLLLLLCLPCSAQLASMPGGLLVQAPVAAGGGTPNNFAIVQSTVTNSTSAVNTITKGFGSSVTAGNVLVIAAVDYSAASTHNWAVGDVAKLAGTATIGSFTMDVFTNVLANTTGSAIFHANITGSGTLTNSLTVTSSALQSMTMVEVSGVSTSSTIGTTGKNSGSGTTATTGSVTTTGAGGMFALEDDEGTDVTRTFSGTKISSQDTGASTMSWIFQYKTFNSTPTTMTNNLTSAVWRMSYATFLTN